MSKVFDIIHKEQHRQDTTIELIASENFPSENIKQAVGSCMMNKYTEGYPSARYYGGCQFYDELEIYCQEKWREVFHTDYHVNVQPNSGSQANQEALAAVLNVGDSLLAMDLSAGGHLTHGSKASILSRMYDCRHYGVDENGLIDYEQIEKMAQEIKPKLIMAGASAYSRIINFNRISQIAKSVGAYFMVDMAHIAGLVATGFHPTPFDLADIITTTTQKTLRGNRGGLIFCKPELAKKVDIAVFPRYQGGSLMNEIAGKAITAEEACEDEFIKYIGRVVKNSKAMCEEFKCLGYRIVSGGTDNHLFLLNFSDKNVTGKQVQEACDKIGITLNKNSIPNDPRKPSETSGVRIGTAAMTTKGYGVYEFVEVARQIDEVIKSLQKVYN